MNKYSVFSLATLIIFVVMFFTMLSGVSLGTFGKAYILSLFLFPLLGTFFRIQSKKKFIEMATNHTKYYCNLHNR
ncbi:MAG: hypothetical protein RR588_13200, partial [Solibacillus sp.]